MKRRSDAQIRRQPAGASARSTVEPEDRSAIPPEERPSDKPASGVERSSERRSRERVPLGAALAAVERSFKMPKDVEDRILARLLRRSSAGTVRQRLAAVEQGIKMPQESEDRILRVILARGAAARAKPVLDPPEASAAVEGIASERLSWRRTRVSSRVAIVSVAILAICVLVAGLTLRLLR
jgi:hypothetical protein